MLALHESAAFDQHITLTISGCMQGDGKWRSSQWNGSDSLIYQSYLRDPICSHILLAP